MNNDRSLCGSKVNSNPDPRATHYFLAGSRAEPLGSLVNKPLRLWIEDPTTGRTVAIACLTLQYYRAWEQGFDPSRVDDIMGKSERIFLNYMSQRHHVPLTFMSRVAVNLNRKNLCVFSHRTPLVVI